MSDLIPDCARGYVLQKAVDAYLARATAPYTLAAERRCPTCGCPLTERDGRTVPIGVEAVDELLRQRRWLMDRNDAIVSALREARETLDNLVDRAEFAMEQANRDGGEFDIDGELADARAALAKINAALKGENP